MKPKLVKVLRLKLKPAKFSKPKPGKVLKRLPPYKPRTKPGKVTATSCHTTLPVATMTKRRLKNKPFRTRSPNVKLLNQSRSRLRSSLVSPERNRHRRPFPLLPRQFLQNLRRRTKLPGRRSGASASSHHLSESGHQAPRPDASMLHHKLLRSYMVSPISELHLSSMPCTLRMPDNPQMTCNIEMATKLLTQCNRENRCPTLFWPK